MWISILIGVYLLIPVCLYLLKPKEPTQGDLDRRKRVAVIVLGDLGRSPRMNYHALSLAKGGLRVQLCGYVESKLSNQVIENEFIEVIAVPEIVNDGKLPFLVYVVYKVIVQHYHLYKLLRQVKNGSSDGGRLDFMIVQVPPSIPTLGMIRFFSLFMSPQTKVIIDWHNFGYSILALKVGMNHLYVRLYKFYEQWFGYRAFVHLTVTVSMGQILRNEFGMNGRRIIPLHDRPASQFTVLDGDQRKAIITKYKHSIFEDYNPEKNNNEKIIVSSTSYTPDENLTKLFEALKLYVVHDASDKPKLRVIITGKGPMYDQTQAEIGQLRQDKQFNEYITIYTVWLPSEDYPKILGVADLGVSLHESSSGWDLPMKIVDMFGCGIPCIALGFPALSELVKHESNGLIVNDSNELANCLFKLFTSSSSSSLYNQLKRGAIKESKIKWDSEWMEKIGPLFGIGRYQNEEDED